MRWLGLFRNKTFRKHLKLIFPHWDFITRIVSLEIFHPYFVIRIFPSVFYHPHFSIRILSSAIFHPHFIIRNFLSAFYHPHFSIRHPVRTLQRPVCRRWCRPKPTCTTNSGKKIFISRQASSRKTPETASAAEHGLRKRLTVLPLIQGRSDNFFSSA